MDRECWGVRCRIPSQSSLLPNNVDKRSGTTGSRHITYADDTTTGTSAETVEKVIAMLEEDAINVLRFMASNGLIVNPNKKSFIILNSK